MVSFNTQTGIITNPYEKALFDLTHLKETIKYPITKLALNIAQHKKTEYSYVRKS